MEWQVPITSMRNAVGSGLIYDLLREEVKAEARSPEAIAAYALKPAIPVASDLG